MNEEKNDTIEIDYRKASTKAIFASNLFDGFMMLVLAFLLLLLNNFIFSKTTLGIKTTNERNDIIISSHLYRYENDDNTGSIKDVYSIIYNDGNKNYNEKSEEFDKVLTLFFTDFVKDISIYDTYKKEAIYSYNNEETNLFVKENDTYIRNTALNNSDYDSTYYEFYSDLIKEKAPGYLFKSTAYRNNLKTQIIQNVLLFYLALFIASIVVYYIIPLFLKRGRKTFGMKMTSIALVDVRGLSVTFKRFTLRYLFFFFVILSLSLVSFLIPILVSITMSFVSKSGQSLTDYVLNTYKVDSSTNSIYLDEIEYMTMNRDNLKVDIEHLNVK